MEKICDLAIDSCERSIKFDKKIFRTQLVWNLFNFSILFYDAFGAIHNSSLVSAAGFGAMIVTCFWSLGFTLVQWGEIRDNKQKLRFLEELKETQMASGERQQYINARDHYNQLIKQTETEKKEI